MALTSTVIFDKRHPGLSGCNFKRKMGGGLRLIERRCRLDEL